jgi:hypothetical protein
VESGAVLLHFWQFDAFAGKVYQTDVFTTEGGNAMKV